MLKWIKICSKLHHDLCIRVLVMDLVGRKGLTQRQKDCINKNVQETIKCIAASLEVENDNFDNDLFYTPPSSLSEPISNGLEAHLHVNQARRWSCIIFNVHLNISNQLVHPENHAWCHPPLEYTLNLPSWRALVESNQKPREKFLLSHTYYNLAMDFQLQQ